MKQTVAKLIDTTLCIGCKACEVACQEWNDQEFSQGVFHNSYQTMPDLAAHFWNLIKFHEVEKPAGPVWLMAKYQCMHCADAGCLRACPAPGAIIQRENGIIDFVEENCIGCGYCITGCPFDVPRLSPRTNKVYKCSLCSDRVAVGLSPACIKACPTSCLTFGSRADLKFLAEKRAEELRAEGFSAAGVYDGPGVGGTNVLYVLKYADEPELYGLPKDPKIPWTVRLWKGPLKWVGNTIFFGGILAAIVHYLKVGPKEAHEDD
ncbi:MAG: formate dehydrogenase subunit beta [Bryobacteraceae bacterium]|nr:formate dehydrogenase subunit beta [Bryobacteraceae bacterium]MDW8377102.1 formate dehydrogenase subunit beta [Bryobacterales bacterium]